MNSKQKEKRKVAATLSVDLEELETRKAYWKGIERATAGRFLHGAELAVANDAWASYVRLLEQLRRPASEFPEHPKPATVPKIRPFELACLVQAARSDKKPALEQKPVAELFGDSRDLLIQAASYLDELQKNSEREFAMGTAGITFDEILDSNNAEDRRKLKLLPGITGGKQSAKSERYRGLIECIRRYFSRDDHELLMQADVGIKVGIALRRGQSVPKALEKIQRLESESFIRERFLPTMELVKIRAWHFREKRKLNLTRGKNLSRQGDDKKAEL
jgi:hypothetical protein